MKIKGDGKWRVTGDEWPEKWEGYPTPPVFCAKSVHLLDCKGLDFCKSDKEFVRVSWS
jgi:hypothetical protein